MAARRVGRDAGRVVLPIFPLPEVVLFPHTLLPLHVFEARYRAMVTDSLARDRRIAVVGLRPGYEDSYEGKPAVFPVAGAGEIVQWSRLASGRYDIVLRGDGRVRIERELPTDTLYRVVAATRLDDRTADGPAIAALADGVRDRGRRVLRAIGRAGGELGQALERAKPPGVLADQVAAALLASAEDRQALLDDVDVERRLRRLAGLLDGVLRDVGGER